MTMDWRSGIVIALAVQAMLLAVLLWQSRERAANRYLALTLLILAGIVVVYPLGWRGHNEVPVWLAFLPCNLPLALGPLFYAYTRSIAQLPRARWVHAAPPVVQLGYLVTLSLLPADVAHAWKESAHDHVVKPLVELAVLISLAGYAIASRRLLTDFRRRLRAARSDADLHDARWLSRLLTTLVLAVAGLSVVRIYTNFIAEIDSSSYLIALAAWSAWLGIEGWRVAGVPAPVLPDEAPVEDDRQSRDWPALGAAWQARLSDGGWWKEPDLTLAGLARRLGTNAHALSRAVNEGLGMNFNEMVNRLRAEHVARLIDAGATAGLLQVALEAGFSSKATFNRAFRAVHGVDPSTYRRRLIS